MTNIQAINLLKGLEQSLDDYCELNDEGKTAFRMAITALEVFGNSEQLPSVQPEPCEDAVSREAVSKWLKQYGLDVLHGKYKFSLMYIWKNLMALPSAQPVARDINVLSNDLISRQEAIDQLHQSYNLFDAERRLEDLPSAQPDGISLEWIDKHLEWLDNCDNDFAQLAKVSIRAMVELWKKDGETG